MLNLSKTSSFASMIQSTQMAADKKLLNDLKMDLIRYQCSRKLNAENLGSKDQNRKDKIDKLLTHINQLLDEVNIQDWQLIELDSKLEAIKFKKRTSRKTEVAGPRSPLRARRQNINTEAKEQPIIKASFSKPFQSTPGFFSTVVSMREKISQYLSSIGAPMHDCMSFEPETSKILRDYLQKKNQLTGSEKAITDLLRGRLTLAGHLVATIEKELVTLHGQESEQHYFLNEQHQLVGIEEPDSLQENKEQLPCFIKGYLQLELKPTLTSSYELTSNACRLEFYSEYLEPVLEQAAPSMG